MRIYLKLVKEKGPSTIIPYNYQHLLTGAIHKWLGANNDEHGKVSLYSFSWLQNMHANKNGLKLTPDSFFVISAYREEIIKKITRGIIDKPTTFYGIRVSDIQILDNPEFSTEHSFFLYSPILIRKREVEKNIHVTHRDEDFEHLLTENFKHKLEHAKLKPEGVMVQLDKSYSSPQTKLVDYKGVKNKTTLAPIIIKGSPEQLTFAWNVGMGHSTGIGFGALK